MRFTTLIAAIGIAAWPALAVGQARPLVTTSAAPVVLSNTPGDQIVLGSVSLGRQRSFTMFNVQASGTIKPDPQLNGAAFQLQFLICDQPDCSGSIKSGARMLQDAGSDSTAQLIATKSFGISGHNSGPVVLPDYPPSSSGAPLYLAVALKVVHSPGTIPFTGKLNLLRIDVMP